LALKLESIESLDNELRRANEKMEQMYFNKGSETTLKLEVEQLKKENKRLVGMLKQTKEYHGFGEFVEDSGGAVRAIKAAKGLN